MTKPKKPEERKRRGRPRRKWPSLSNTFSPVLHTVLDPEPGRPLKWDSNRYARLLLFYAHLRIKDRTERGAALRDLAIVANIGHSDDGAGRDAKKVEERIRKARADARTYGWGAALPEWARPVLSPRFNPRPRIKK